MASGNNQTRFFWSRWDAALASFDAGDLETADDLCCGLISNYTSPRLCQIQACQLRSLCTKDFWFAKFCLETGMDIIKDMNDDENPLVQQYKSHTQLMLDDVKARLAKKYHAKGMEVPDKQPVEEYDQEDEDEEDTAKDGEAEVDDRIGLARQTISDSKPAALDAADEK